MAIILMVIGILVLILEVTLPLFSSAELKEMGRSGPHGDHEVLAIGVGDYLEHGYALFQSGEVSFYHLPQSVGMMQKGDTLPLKGPIGSLRSAGKNQHTLLYNDGTVELLRLEFLPTYQDRKRKIEPKATSLYQGAPFPNGFAAVDARPRGQDLRFIGLKDGQLWLNSYHQASGGGGLFGGASTEELVLDEPTKLDFEGQGAISDFVLNGPGDVLAAATKDQQLLWLELDGQGAVRQRYVKTLPAPIRSFAFVFGGRSLIVNLYDGSRQAFGLLRGSDHQRELVAFKTFSQTPAPIATTHVSTRDKGFISLTTKGTLRGDYLTTGEELFQLKGSALEQVALAPRNNAILGLEESGRLVFWHLEQFHPEVTLSSLFTKVWYEGYQSPEHVWQSTGGSDEFEPKLGVMPLIYGTLKATFYALILALPLSLLGAIYISQFASQKLRAWVKPTIEMMAGLPSVVIGFLLALWLAPLIEQWFVFLALLSFLGPVLGLIWLFCWARIRHIPRFKPLERGYEYLAAVPILLLAALLSFGLAPVIEQHWFGASFPQWLYDHLGVRYDQRNSFVISIGLGFAVIPIIFSISEDALSSVPKNLSAASLALGASRWQTVQKVILPSASPGIFVAVMMGLGRAVGETMIVLMAAGNTPIMSANPFAGMRTLSANIAVEVAEAPVGGSLYRTLFLCAVILFVFTFILNTLGEVVRQRLRKSYGRF